VSSDERGISSADLSRLVEISRVLTAEMNLTHLLELILQEANVLTDSTASSVILYDRGRDLLYFAHATGPNATMLLDRWGKSSEEGVPVEDSIAGVVFETGRPVRTESAAAKPRHFEAVDQATEVSTEALICVPLSVGDVRIGVVQLLNKRDGDYTDRDLALLDHFAAQAAIAIRNAQMFDDLLAHMGLYVSQGPQQDPRELLEELHRPARLEKISILFADMRGFTQLCHVVARPEKIQEMLNQFLEILATCVLEENGIVNKFLGDGLLGLFRGEEHALRAVRAGTTMVSGFQELRGRWDKNTNTPLAFLDLGVGIVTDTAIVGAIGGGRVRDFTAVGTPTNLAHNLVKAARNGRRILVDKMTFLAVRDSVETYEGPEHFDLKAPGQQVGHPYERYHIMALRGSSVADQQPTAPKPAPPTKRQVFVSYCHRDQEWVKDLRRHLTPYTRSGEIDCWDDSNIRSGDRWRDEISARLANASVAVLLVSPHFLDSDFIAANELPPLLKKAEDAGLTILWVPISACSYDVTPIGDYQATIDPSRPLDLLPAPEQNRAWVKICKQIKAAVEQ
jgi:class 3 adenylate cyclase